MFIKAIILIAGPQKGTRFRPLSLDVPKPLFPVAGIPIVQHHIEALARVDVVQEILLLGFYPSSEMSDFVQDMNRLHANAVRIRYLQEFAALGTAGGLYHFRDQIRSGDPDAFFVLNGDVCADFPLSSMLKFHLEQKDLKATIMATEATKGQSLNYGCIVADKQTNAMMHYVEKPESYISPMINCGVYLFSLKIFDLLAKVFQGKQRDYYNGSYDNIEAKEAMWLEKDILMPLAGSNQVKVYVTNQWWSQIKTAGAAIYANRHYLKLYRMTNPSRLAQNLDNCNGNGKIHKDEHAEIIGDVYIHPTAQVHPTAVVSSLIFMLH